jgi:hypothetical protein
MDKQVLWEAVKEPLRLLVLALIPFAITYFASLPYEWAVLATVVLRFIDKLMHELGKEFSTKTEESSLLKGLTRF